MKYLIFFAFIFNSFIAFSQYKKINNKTWEGTASFYSNSFNGRRTASGEVFSNSKLSAANNFLKLGTKVKVTNISNGKSVVLKINDRMNARNKRLIDLSKKAANDLGFQHAGLCKVKIEKY
jgi:rare lipoprotein A